MPIFLILVLIVFLTILVGIAVSVGVSRLDKAIKDNQAALAAVGSAYNVNLTMGHQISVAADFESQLKEARQLAAKNAASQPRGANMGIGSLGNSTLRTTSKNLANDPVSTVRIAKFHGWEGVRTGIAAAGQTAAAAAPAAAAAGGKIELVAGKDYPVIEITDDMPDAEKRKARIANAKAKSAAMKAAKAAGTSGAAPAAAAAAASAVPLPKLVEITDDMGPDEKRKATIANAKAQSAYKKALKAAGETGATAPAAAATPAAPAAPAIPEPELIEITDSMSPDEVRKARISNAKAKSAYNKALKAAGASAPAAAPSAPAAPAPVAAPEPAANMPAPPELVEITDGMDPDELRKARIANAKAKSAYNKALKAAGIDPKSV